MVLAFGSDHAGFPLKLHLIEFAKKLGYDVLDFGCDSAESCDYPDYAFLVARALNESKADFGILICGSGIGMSIAANKIKGIRAANCCSVEMAKLARLHNDANVLALGARLIPSDLAEKILLEFLNTSFEGGRHIRRIEKIHNATNL